MADVQQELQRSEPVPAPTNDEASPQPQQRLTVDIYQLTGNDMFRGHRIDGTGWHWSWADWRRDWMDETPGKYAYRCLPLTIANQTGWWVYNPVAFTARWNGQPGPGGVQFLFDNDPKLWSQWINNQFGEGIITWNTPFLFRTQPVESRLLVMGPVNNFKDGAQPLTAIIESDWMNMSFTMNWKLTSPGTTVRFELGEPLFQAIPLVSNLCRDLERADVRFQTLESNPALAAEYNAWREGRSTFHQKKRAGQVKPDDWQKDYFRGQDTAGESVSAGHMTRVKPPQIEFRTPKP